MIFDKLNIIRDLFILIVELLSMINCCGRKTSMKKLEKQRKLLSILTNDMMNYLQNLTKIVSIIERFNSEKNYPIQILPYN